MRLRTAVVAAALAVQEASAFAPPHLARLSGLVVRDAATAQPVRRTAAPAPLFGKGKLADELASTGEGGEESGAGMGKKEKVKLEPEVTIFEGPPDISETFVPAVSILTVIGIIPFAASVARQAWVKYKITSRRVSVQSGINGRDFTEIVYPDFKRMVFVYRFFGRCGDVVIELRDGSRLELRSLPNFEENYNYMLERCPKACQEVSDKISSSKSAEASDSKDAKASE